ncbi:hypothetical protein [Aquiflexum gelatinilyticum]|uniref:Uncharacterized protein n=1 Tax=Aquiflexum gelatinilyticum TaxID=2961943 RepID=A0A9X2P459_9BACT|nr:hypothetical protein [Aquiflexum gelatinilyticum]MCR9013798.1 hypothetical protein [Aquiflexum gelatinilyticum]MCS4433485.1 hypothetical protein [Aquiflexum gelatinilyticum]
MRKTVEVSKATFLLDQKSSQKSQDGGILSTHKAGAGPVRRRPTHLKNTRFSIKLRFMKKVRFAYRWAQNN